jgi:hypothetical protein
MNVTCKVPTKPELPRRILSRAYLPPPLLEEEEEGWLLPK